MTEQYHNFGQTTLITGITATATTLTVNNAAEFPIIGNFDIVVTQVDSNGNMLVINDVPVNAEIMSVTSVSGNVFTVIRGQEGTLAVSHSAGEIVANVLTAGRINNLQSSIPITPSASFLPNFRAAIANVKNGTSDTKIVVIGDSTSIGYGSTTTTTAMRYNGYPNKLAAYFASSGINAEANGWIGDGGLNSTSPSSTLDGRIVVGSGWSETGIEFPGGCSFQASSTTSNLSFTPTVQVDKFVVTYLQFSGIGTFSYKIGSGSTTNVNCSGTASIQTVTISANLGTNTLNLNWVSGGLVCIIGIDAYNSTIGKQVHIINGGWTGSKSGDWQNVISVLSNTIPNTFLLGQSLTIIQLGINDMNSGVSVASYTSNMQALITACLAAGDVVLMTAEPESTANASAAIQVQFQQAVISLASTNSIGVIDMYGRWVSYTVSNAAGLYYDSTHPNATGYTDVGQAIFNALGQSGEGSGFLPLSGGTVTGPTTFKGGENVWGGFNIYDSTGVTNTVFNQLLSGDLHVSSGSGYGIVLAYPNSTVKLGDALSQNNETYVDIDDGNSQITLWCGGSNVFLDGSGGLYGPNWSLNNNPGYVSALFTNEVDFGNGGYTDPSPGYAYDAKYGGPAGGGSYLGSVNTNASYNVNNVVFTTPSLINYPGGTTKFADSSNNIYSTLATGSLLKSNGTGSAVTAAVAGTDYVKSVATVDATGNSAAVAGTLFTPTTSGSYEIDIILQVTRAATSSSILGGTTSVIIGYTEPDGSVAQTVVAPLFSQAGLIINPSAGNTGNLTTTSSNGIAVIRAKSGVAVTYSIGYSSTGATTMQYSVHLKAKAI